MTSGETTRLAREYEATAVEKLKTSLLSDFVAYSTLLATQSVAASLIAQRLWLDAQS